MSILSGSLFPIQPRLNSRPKQSIYQGIKAVTQIFLQIGFCLSAVLQAVATVAMLVAKRLNALVRCDTLLPKHHGASSSSFNSILSQLYFPVRAHRPCTARVTKTFQQNRSWGQIFVLLFFPWLIGANRNHSPANCFSGRVQIIRSSSNGSTFTTETEEPRLASDQGRFSCYKTVLLVRTEIK